MRTFKILSSNHFETHAILLLLVFTGATEHQNVFILSATLYHGPTSPHLSLSLDSPASGNNYSTLDLDDINLLRCDIQARSGNVSLSVSDLNMISSMSIMLPQMTGFHAF